MPIIPTQKLQITSLVFLLGAAAIGYIFDFLILLNAQDLGWSGSMLGVVGYMPCILVVALIQEYSLQIRQGKIAFFSTQSSSHLGVTNFVLFAIVVMLWLIPLALRQVTNVPKYSVTSYFVLMIAAYIGTGILHFLKKHPPR